jgi:hypothetical protein
MNFKNLKSSSLKSLIDASLLSKYKEEECQALVCTSIRVLITYNELKMKKIWS